MDSLMELNDKNTPAVLKLWILKVGTGMKGRVKHPATFPNCKNIYNQFSKTA